MTKRDRYKSRVELPRQTQHLLHRHPLSLGSCPSRCGACEEGLCGFTYQCEKSECGFVLDFDCASVATSAQKSGLQASSYLLWKVKSHLGTPKIYVFLSCRYTQFGLSEFGSLREVTIIHRHLRIMLFIMTMVYKFVMFVTRKKNSKDVFIIVQNVIL